MPISEIGVSIAEIRASSGECRLKRILSIVSAGRYLSRLGRLEDFE